MSQKLDLSYPYGKFWRGIVRWSRDGEIDLKSEKGISQVNALLKVICHSPASDCYDGNFNGLSHDAVANSLNIDLDAEEYHSDYPHSYRIEHITSFEQALKYRNPDSEIISITSRWNYGDDENDDFLTQEQLETLLQIKIS